MGTSEDDRVWGEYVLLEVVGRGPRSTVHRARRRDRAGRIVAVKHLHVDVTAHAVGRLWRDSATLAALDHPAIAPLLDLVDGPDGTIALVLPYAAGGSLGDVLDRRGHLPWPRVADVGARLASALSAAHDAGVLHGDITPANVLLGPRDAPLLTDFGTAALRQDVPASGRDRAVTTADVVAPEVALGGDPSARNDLYHLGVVLERALGDRADVPAELVAVVERAVARDPADRFGSARSLQEALEPFVPLDATTRPHGLVAPGSARAVGGPGTAMRSDGVVPPPIPSGRSRPAWAGPVLAGVAVVALAVSAGLWVAGRGGGAPPTATATSPAPVEVAPRQPAPRCPGVAEPGANGLVLDADVDGRGCTLPVVVTEELVDDDLTLVLRVPPGAGSLAGRYAVGGAGDQVVVGDWDCDGTDTPAVVRALDGRVFRFDGYGELDPVPAPALPDGAAPQVVTDADGCDHVTGDAG